MALRTKIFIVAALTAAAVMVTVGNHRHAPPPTKTVVLNGKRMHCEGLPSVIGGYPTSWYCRPAPRTRS